MRSSGLCRSTSTSSTSSCSCCASWEDEGTKASPGSARRKRPLLRIRSRSNQRQPSDRGVGRGPRAGLLFGRLGLSRIAEEVRLDSVLPVVEIGVAPAAGKELFVAAAFDDQPVLDDEDRVRLADRGQTVGDDKSRAPFHELRETFLNQRLALAIERGGGLVQDQD